MNKISPFKRPNKRKNMKPKKSKSTTTWFDKEHPEQYVCKWCLYKKSYEHEYTKIYVFDVKNGIVKYKTSCCERECYCPQEEFDCCEFIVSPFDNYDPQSDKVIRHVHEEIYVGDPPNDLDGHDSTTTKTVEYPFPHVDPKVDSDTCHHEWFESILTSYPPIVQRTCRKCGKVQHIPQYKNPSKCITVYPDDQFVDGPF